MDCADLIVNFSSLRSMLENFSALYIPYADLVSNFSTPSSRLELGLEIKKIGTIFSALHIPSANFVINFSAL